MPSDVPNSGFIISILYLRYESGYRTASFDREFNKKSMDFLTAPGFLSLDVN